MMSKPITEYEECIICYKDLDGTNDIKLKNCGHVFHKDCLKEWFARHNEQELGFTLCPFCRTINTIDFTRWQETNDIKLMKEKHHPAFPSPPKIPTNILIWRGNSFEPPSYTERRGDYVRNLAGVCPMPHFLDLEPIPSEKASFEELEKHYSRALYNFEIASLDYYNALEYNTGFLRYVLQTSKKPMTIQETVQNERILNLTNQWRDEADTRLDLIGVSKWKAYIREARIIKKEKVQEKTLSGKLSRKLSTIARGITKKMHSSSRARVEQVIPFLEDKERKSLPPIPKRDSPEYLNYVAAKKKIRDEDRKYAIRNRSEVSCALMGGKHNKSKKIRNRKHRKAKKSRKPHN